MHQESIPFGKELLSITTQGSEFEHWSHKRLNLNPSYAVDQLSGIGQVA